MRSAPPAMLGCFVLASSVWACGGDEPVAVAASSGGAAAGAAGSAPGGGGGTGAIGGATGEGGGAGLAGGAGAAPVECDETYATPPKGLSGWSEVLSQAGAETLTIDPEHSHDDRRGPVGFCPASAASGARRLALVSARFETDASPPDVPCVVDYTAPDPTLEQYGACWSGGNRHIYVEVRDEAGARVEAGFEVFFGGQTEAVPDQDKPPNEFPMNFAINGGGAIYGARASYVHPEDGPLPSDAVTNMRLPLNHHVSYLLTFQVLTQ